jgi:hypothetical protein
VESLSGFAGKSSVTRTQISGRFLRPARIPRQGERNLTIRQLIQLQRQRLRSRNPVERFAASLLIPSELRKRLNSLNDREIGQLLDDEVVSRMSVLGPESTICFAAADRLRRRLILSRRHKRLGTPRTENRPSTLKRNDGEHIMHAESALYRAGIPFLLLPFQQNRFASSTFLVRNIGVARLCLHRAGFRVNPHSPTVLIDWQTRQPIRLYEDTIVL